MVAPVSFPTSTPRFALPMLFAGQAQKEFFINQNSALVDALLHASASASQAAPPNDPHEGDCFRIVAPASEDWQGKEDDLAIRIGGAWQFVQPAAGLRVFDEAKAAFLHYDGEWHEVNAPAQAEGGAIVDLEARQMLQALVEALRNAGIFSAEN